MDYDKTAKALMQMQSLLDTCREKYDFHMAQVRRGSDPDLRDMHLRAAQREYDTIDQVRDHIARVFDSVREA